MEAKEKILRPVGKGSAGIHLPHFKNTAELETLVMPVPEEVTLPMSQHIGAPAKPVVKVGDKVFVGTMLGEAGGFVSAPVHSSVSGTVKSITEKDNGTFITVTSDGEMTPDPDLKPFEIKEAKDFAAAAEACGLVGLGGAGFPAKVKLSVKEDQRVEYLVVNAAECEPYITSDYRECMESYDDVIEGIYLLKKALNIEKVIICVESNKKKAIEKLYEIASAKEDVDDTVKLMRLPTRYPQGAEKVLIYSATGRKVPAGKLPIDVGCIVMNVTSIATLNRFIKTGMPLVSKRVTVDGNAVKEPKNVIVPIGTPIKQLLDFVGVIDDEANEIIMGGPMMGMDVVSADSVVEKRNNAITVMKPDVLCEKTTPCIRCGRCVRACPMKLYPASIETAVKHNNMEALGKLNVNYCMECGSCSFVCPAKHPLTQSIRLGKAKLRAVKK